MTHEVRYLLFDVESVADGELIAKTLYPSVRRSLDSSASSEPRETRFNEVSPSVGLSPADAIARFRQELLMSQGRDFIPYTFHFPVAVVIAKVRSDFSLHEIVSLDQPEHRPHVITKHFWTGWEAYEQPTWVTFNGRTFDIPLMEHAAFRYGIPVPKWFNLADRSYEQKRNRYNFNSHIDLQEMLTNYGSTRYRGGLNLAASMLGKPGKMDVQGDMVYDMYLAGKVAEINEYCRCDVLDTYFVFLRTMLLMGRLTLEQEQKCVLSAKSLLESQASEHPAYESYLAEWGDWHNPWIETTPSENSPEASRER